MTVPRGTMARPWACLKHTDVTRARTHRLHDMCGVHPVAATMGTMPKPCAVSQLMKPWAQCHGLMGHQTIADSQHDTYAQHRGAMPCAPRGISHGRNAMARCYGARPDGGSKQHALDMARAYTSVWGRRTDALDTWSTGWCMLPRSESLDQRHASEHPVIRGTLRGRRQLVRGTFQQLGEQGLRRWQCS